MLGLLLVIALILIGLASAGLYIKWPEKLTRPKVIKFIRLMAWIILGLLIATALQIDRRVEQFLENSGVQSSGQSGTIQSQYVNDEKFLKPLLASATEGQEFEKRFLFTGLVPARLNGIVRIPLGSIVTVRHMNKSVIYFRGENLPIDPWGNGDVLFSFRWKYLFAHPAGGITFIQGGHPVFPANDKCRITIEPNEGETLIKQDWPRDSDDAQIQVKKLPLFMYYNGTKCPSWIKVGPNNSQYIGPRDVMQAFDLDVEVASDSP